MSETTERWLPIPGYEGYYEVSDLGRVRSVTRTVADQTGSRVRVFRERVLTPTISGTDGRRLVCLAVRGRRTYSTIYPLVLTAFVGPRPPGMDGCHNDGDSLNDHLTNLRWDTRSENNRDAVRHGTHGMARKTHCARGHLLEPPNLTASGLRTGRRICLACERGRAKVRKSRGRIADLQQASDEQYARIAAG